MKKKILLVDDENNILNGMQRMLFPMRREWEVLTAANGQEALQVMQLENIALIISDMRMPKMDGYELLSIVKEKYPSVFRIALTGQSEKENVINALKLTHKYLHKPCNANELINCIKALLTLEKYTNNDSIINIINGLGEIPSLPDVYWRLEKELMSEEVSTLKISRLLSSDPLISAKIIQIVNSSLFGLQAEILDLGQAVSFLGVELLKSLILYVKIFSSYKLKQPALNFLYKIISNSIKTAEYAKTIAIHENFEKKIVEKIYITSLIKEIGIVVMAQLEQYNEIITQIDENNYSDICELESKIMGVAHPEIGAYLLDLWEFPKEIVNAVGKHHSFINDGNCINKFQLTIYFADSIYYNYKNNLTWFEKNSDQEMITLWKNLKKE